MRLPNLSEAVFRAKSPIQGGYDPQTRIALGSAAQLVIRRELKKIYGPRLKYISIAEAGSQLADIVVRIDGKPVRFEVKNRASRTTHVTMFDTSCRRGGSNDLLDDLAGTISGGRFNNFEALIDSYRTRNPAIGFPGDKGTPPSGKLPPEFRSVDGSILDPVYLHLIARFHESGDNYFAIYSRNTGDVEIYYTGVGENVLGAPEIPHLSKLCLDTYGAAYKGAMRVALKVKFDSQGIVFRGMDSGTPQVPDVAAA